MNKQSEQELLDRIAALEGQVRSLLPKPPKADPLAEKVRDINETQRQAEIDSMKRSISLMTEKPPEPEQPSIAGKTFHPISREVIPLYQAVDLTRLAEIVGCTVEQIQEDADRFGLPVEKLVSQVTGLLARPKVGGGYEFQRSL